ncbi:MAG: hypothetical protein OEV49_11750 [candidate division Zixibacteria bacterium]|nr:hypothetical protein [candidate division Zixibacteria bacterium]MDH3936003.1 hypothetical protein [candidate division Zixibacteria bacterium]MDH4033975.1 hypothetical protein [candidate division Zixibacteria bacterium]
MSNRIILLIAAACLVIVVVQNCTEDTSPNGPQAPQPVLFADYVHFDTTSYMILRTTMAPPAAEAYVWCEKSVGEPFIDNNGNGVFDPGVDLFIMSRGPDNQDLNDNGKHDGAEDPWSPGVPFDDLDGDGDRDCDSNWLSLPNREPGVPYCDLNDNGQWDKQPQYLYLAVRWRMSEVDSIAVEYTLFPEDSIFSIQSDSGLFYWYPDVLTNSSMIGKSIFRIRDNVLRHRPYLSLVAFTVFKSDTILLDTIRVSSTFPNPGASYRRTIDTGQSLTIEGRQFDNLLVVAYDDYTTMGGGGNPEGNFFSAYFSKALGLLAFHLPAYSSGEGEWFYLDQRFDSLPLPMIE